MRSKGSRQPSVGVTDLSHEERYGGANAMSGTILIVDDEADIRSTVEFNLEREGFRTVTAWAAKRWSGRPTILVPISSCSI